MKEMLIFTQLVMNSLEKNKNSQILTNDYFYLQGVPQIRPQVPVFREMNSPRGNMQNRPRMPLNVRNNGAGDTFYQTFHY